MQDSRKKKLQTEPTKKQQVKPGLRALQMEISRLERRAKQRKEIWGIVSRVLFVAMAVLLINIYVARFAIVRGASMEPTLYNGDVVICSPLGYEPEVGDIVVTEMDMGEGRLIKRVVALPGDTVDISRDTGTVSINGKEINEPYIKGATYIGDDMEFPVSVPYGHVFLLGDNRENSIDSRKSEVGMVPECTILGKVYFRLLPFGSIGSL